MSYGGELTFTIRHSPVTRLPTNDRSDRDGGAFVQMKVITKLFTNTNYSCFVVRKRYSRIC